MGGVLDDGLNGRLGGVGLREVVQRKEGRVGKYW